VWFVSRDALLRLHQLTDADRAPPDPSLCVEGRAPVARRLAGRLAVDPGLATKCLLYGARGGGKSTQMHDLKRRLSGVFEVIDVDLDRSGVAIAGLTAFDLMYIVGVAALRLVTKVTRRPGTRCTRPWPGPTSARTRSASSSARSTRPSTGSSASARRRS
jgi:hypothetical protein